MSGKPQRLIALLAVLQVRRVTTAEALAAEFGVSVRTILRDIQALIDADIPVLTERGKYGGISLLPGSQADLSKLTASEADVVRAVGLDLGRAARLGAETAATPNDSGVLAHIPGRIKPTAHRNWWVFLGLVLQLAGVGAPAAYVWTKAKHQDVGGLITVATIKLTWHESLHAKAGVAVLAGGAAVFALGCMALARPFVKHWVTLLVAVPVAALCGALVLGAAALIIAVLFAIFSDGGDLGSGWGGGGGGKKKKGETDADAAAAQLSDQAG